MKECSTHGINTIPDVIVTKECSAQFYATARFCYHGFMVQERDLKRDEIRKDVEEFRDTIICVTMT